MNTSKKDSFEVISTETPPGTSPKASPETSPEHSSVVVPDLPSEKQLDKVYRHLDRRIIPALWCVYFLSSFGGSAYGNTLTMNFEQHHSLSDSLHLTNHDISTASALATVGFILFDLPMNLIMTQVSPQVWLCRIGMGVSLCDLCYNALTNARGLIAIRFIAGVAGAGSWPGLTYYVSLWYPEQRTAKRIGYYFTAGQISAAVAGLAAAGFQRMDMVRGLYGWKWMYIVYGTIYMSIAISLIWWLPDRPKSLIKKTKWDFQILPDSLHRFFSPPEPLSVEERRMHSIDMEQRYKLVKWGFADLLRVILDVRTLALVMMYFGVVGTGMGIDTFATTLIRASNPHLTGIQVSLLYAPIWLFDFAAILLITPLADRFKNQRWIIFCCSCLVIITGLLVATYAHNSWSRWGGLCIVGFGLGPTVPICMTLASEIMTKVYGDVGCAAAAALVSGLGNLGTVTATYALYTGWPGDEDRLYRNSNMMLVLITGISILSCITLTVMRRFMSETPYKQRK